MNNATEETAGVLPASHAGGDDRAIDPQVTLMRPEKDIENPVLSIIIPALNEESVISEFMDWANEGIAKAGVSAEVMIVDSSSDRTPEFALAKGARVLKTPVRGLGRAYQDALGYARGRYILMGDADCTYDFREVEPFMRRFEEGYEFVMGSRFKGTIEAGAMPALHRYFGTPLTTFILNWTPRKTLTFGGVTPELASGGLPCRPFGPVFRFLMSVSGVSERVFLYPGALRALSQTRRFIL